jgi:hypothetical protein
VNRKQALDQAKRQREAWMRLRGALKDVYAEYGGGEAYLRKERQDFNEGMERREKLFAAESHTPLRRTRNE